MTNIKIEYVEDSDEPVCYSENTAAGVYTTLPWEYAATVDLQGNSLVFRDSAGAITADIKIEVNP